MEEVLSYDLSLWCFTLLTKLLNISTCIMNITSFLSYILCGTLSLRNKLLHDHICDSELVTRLEVREKMLDKNIEMEIIEWGKGI